jgi:mannose-6-phosphate isomerase-like protein (cupin superfamily)
MIIKGQPNVGEQGRTYYELDGFQATVSHFVIRETGPDNPFGPHQHEQRELWFIVAGEGTFVGTEGDASVSAGDLIAIQPWENHGLRTDGHLRWVCLG